MKILVIFLTLAVTVAVLGLAQTKEDITDWIPMTLGTKIPGHTNWEIDGFGLGDQHFLCFHRAKPESSYDPFFPKWLEDLKKSKGFYIESLEFRLKFVRDSPSLYEIRVNWQTNSKIARENAEYRAKEKAKNLASLPICPICKIKPTQDPVSLGGIPLYICGKCGCVFAKHEKKK
jgi:hypothetical protein